jgi:hypothetical protein
MLSILTYLYIKGIKEDKLLVGNNIDMNSNNLISTVSSTKQSTQTNVSNFDNYNNTIPYTDLNLIEQNMFIQPMRQPVPFRTPSEEIALERVYNPLKYPYKSPPFYNQQWYPNQMLPPQVIGCGARNTPCMGGTQIPIATPMTPIDISNRNIAPVNISTRGPLGQPQQVGAIYRVMGNENTVYPLFGRKKYPNGDKWEYYTTIGQYGVKMPVITQQRNTELGTNEIVFIQGQRKAPYRVTMYENDSPEYVPYI